MNFIEKAAYIQGLAEGCRLDAADPKERILLEMAEFLSHAAPVLNQARDDLAEIKEDMDMLIRMIVEPEDASEDELYEVSCPKCGETLYLDEDELDAGSITCPTCGEILELSVAADDENGGGV